MFATLKKVAGEHFGYSFMLHFILLCFICVSTYIYVHDSEKIICVLCMIDNPLSKNCLTASQITPELMCIVQQVVGFGTP